MNQVGHIFAKDARHLRWEIGISLVLTAAYLWAAPSEWRPNPYDHPGLSINDVQKLVAGIASLLVPVSWWLLITRAVQDENLVGDQQWWVTKPYEWGNLLGGKLLFLAAFILVPIFVVKCILLAQGGFSPFASLPALAASLAVLLAFAWLPLMAVASVTSTFARATLTLLGLVVVLLIAGAVVGFLVALGGFVVPWIGYLVVAILLGIGGAAIVLQYRWRMAWTARIVMIATLLLVAAALGLSGNPLFVALTDPRTSTPLQIEQGPPAQIHATGSFAQFAGNARIGVSVPLHVSGMPDGTAINFDGVRVTVEAPDGRHWSSGWQSIWGPMVLAGADQSTLPELPLQVGKDFYNAEQAQPVTLHLRFALTELHVGQVTQLAMPSNEFAVPGFGICAPVAHDDLGGFHNLSCRAPVRQPVRTLVRVQWSDEPCNASVSAGGMIEGEAWAGELSSSPAGFALNSIEGVNFPLSNSDRTENVGNTSRSHPRYLCPGSPVTFTPYRIVRRLEYDATFTDYRMQTMAPPTGSRE
jgi:hypothetical protein